MSEQEQPTAPEGIAILAMLGYDTVTGNWSLIRGRREFDHILPGVLRALAESVETEQAAAARN